VVGRSCVVVGSYAVAQNNIGVMYKKGHSRLETMQRPFAGSTCLQVKAKQWPSATWASCQRMGVQGWREQCRGRAVVLLVCRSRLRMGPIQPGSHVQEGVWWSGWPFKEHQPSPVLVLIISWTRQCWCNVKAGDALHKNKNSKNTVTRCVSIYHTGTCF